MKYVMFEIETKGVPMKYKLPFLFANNCVHKEVADHMHHMLRRQPGCLSSKVVSAGFWRVEDGQIVCFGESESLKAKSDPGDAAIIEMHDYCHGL